MNLASMIELSGFAVWAVQFEPCVRGPEVGEIWTYFTSHPQFDFQPVSESSAKSGNFLEIRDLQSNVQSLGTSIILSYLIAISPSVHQNRKVSAFGRRALVTAVEGVLAKLTRAGDVRRQYYLSPLDISIHGKPSC